MPVTINGTTGITTPAIDNNGVTTVQAGTAALPAITTTGDTNTGIFFPAADTIAFAEGGAEAMRIASTSFVGIGRTSPNFKLHVTGINPNADDNTIGMSYGRSANPTDAVHKISWSSDDLRIEADTANTIASNLIFTNDGTERARIDSSGNLLVGTTSQINTGLICSQGSLNSVNTLVCKNTVAQGGGQSFAFFANSAGNKAGSIDHTGTTTVAYTTSSDYRMKENIAPMTGALTAVLQLKPCTYTWKEDGKAGQGFIAHELQEVCPDCVSGEKDAVDAEGNPQYQGIDTSFLIATLSAAIQELHALVKTQDSTITALTTRITALEGAA